jgi:hypothetical protein
MRNILRRVRFRLDDIRVRRLTSEYRINGGYRRIYHYHIRKTAGTSLNAAFWGLVDLDLREIGTKQRVCRNGLVFVRHSRALIQRGDYFYANSHLPAHALKIPEDTFTIVILRDPLNRLLSHYRYLLWSRDDPHAQKEEPFLKSLEKEAAWLGNSFGDFLDRIPREHLLRQTFMFSKSYDLDEAAERIGSCSAVCFTEDFATDLGSLAEKLNLQLQEKHGRRFSYKVSPSPAEMDRAREMLDPEFILVERVRQKLGDRRRDAAS